MKILIVTTFFPPLNSIASLRPHSWAKEWTRMGHEVTILTTKKNLNPLVDLEYSEENFDLIEVDSFGQKLKKTVQNENFKSKDNSLIKKFLHYVRNQYGIFNACRMPDLTDLWIFPAIGEIKKKNQTWDVVISTAGPYSVHIVGYLLKKKSIATRWIADYRDTWSDNYIYPGIFPFNIVEKILERKLLKNTDLITTVSDPFKIQFEKKISGKTAVTIHNGFDPEDFKSIDPNFAFENHEKYRILHTGSLYLDRRDPTPLFQAIKELSDDPSTAQNLDRLEVLFVGLNHANLKQLILKYDVNRWVKCKNFVSRNKALAMQRDAHQLLFLPWNDPKIDGVLTGKIFEYLYSKTPIISVGCSFLEASQELILGIGAGKSYTSIKEIKKFLLEELNSFKKKTTSIDPLKLECYDRRVIAKKFYETIEKLT